MSEALPENWKQTAARPTVRIAWIGGVLHQWYEFVWGGEGEWRKVEAIELPNEDYPLGMGWLFVAVLGFTFLMGAACCFLVVMIVTALMSP